MFAREGRESLWLACKRINLVSSDKREVGLVFEAYLNSLSGGLSSEHVLFAAHGVADDPIDGLGRSMSLLYCRNHDG